MLSETGITEIYPNPSPYSIEYSLFPTEDSPSADKLRLDAYKHDIGTPLPESAIRKVHEASLVAYAERRYEIEHMDPEIAKATGELPIHTKYDGIDMRNATWLPDELVADAMTSGHFDLAMSLHPARLVALRRAEAREYIPTLSKSITAVEQYNEAASAIHSSAFAMQIISTLTAQQEGLSPVNSANALNCDGLWITTANKNDGIRVTGAIMSNSTPDSQSAHSHAALALQQCRTFITADSIWNEPQAQIASYARSIQLINQNQTIANHPDREFIIDRASNLIGITVRASVKDADKRLNALLSVNPNAKPNVRVYEPRGRTKETAETIAWIHSEFPQATITAGNATDVNEGKAFVDAGAHAISFVLGGGGICETPHVARIAVRNIQQSIEFANAQLGVPLVADSSTGDTYAILAAAGTSGFMKGQDITSGIEKPPYLQWVQLLDGTYASLYSGEAAKRTKWLGGKVDYLGRPIFVEGADTSVTLNTIHPSIHTRLWYINQALSTALLFSRHASLEHLRQDPNPHIVHLEGSAIYAGSVHHGR